MTPLAIGILCAAVGYCIGLVVGIFAAAKHRDRRERIATVCMAALLTKYGVGPEDEKHSAYAVAFADALIAELDKEVKP